MFSLLLQSQIRFNVVGGYLSTAFSVSTWKPSVRTTRVTTKHPIDIMPSETAAAAAAAARTRQKSMSVSLQKYLIIKNRVQLFSSSSDDRYRNIGDTTRRKRNTANDTTSANTTLEDVVTNTGIVTTDDMTYRKSLLHEKLLELDCFADETEVRNFEYVVEQSMIDPTQLLLVPISDDCCNDHEEEEDYRCNSVSSNNRISGVQKYGKSTIKTCQTYYYPKTQPTHPDNRSSTTLKIAATRTARQIEFLYQRHKAQQTQWIRNHDAPSPMSGTVPDTIGTTVFVEDDDNISTMNAVPKRNNYFPFVVVLDNLRSAQNVGSIYRTADATKCQQVITIGITPNPCNGNGIHKIQKSSLGAELFVPTQHFTNSTMALEYIYHTYPTYQIVCVETTSESIPYTDLHYNPTTGNRSSTSPSTSDDCRSNHNNNGMIFIFGNEVTGVDVSFYLSQVTKMNQSSGPSNDGASYHAAAPQKALRIIEIPMYGTKNSLNVAVCVSIILYEMIRQYHQATTVVK